MFSGVLALLERSLRLDARAWGPHLARFGLMVGIYVAVSYAAATSSRFGAPGLRFFQSISYLNLVFMTLLGIGFFSTAISEEKEEDTLGLMLMAGISPLGILLGKSGGRLVQALLLMTIQYPFTLLAVTLGGVTQDQVRSAYIAMFAYMVMLAGLGLLCSTIARRNRTASMRLTFLLVVYLAIPAYCTWVGGINSAYASVFAWVAESCVYLQMSGILATGFRETLLSPQVVTNFAAGGLGFVLSWALFGLAVRDPSSDSSSRGLLSRNRRVARVFSPGRPSINPFVWKDFHFVGGGYATIAIRFAFYISIYVALYAWWAFAYARLSYSEEVTGIYLFVLMFAITFDLALLFSQSLHEEVRGQMLATLMMLPRSTGGILYGKALGSLLGGLPGPICLLAGMTLLQGGPRITDDFFRRGGPPYLFISHFVLVPHAAALSAMFVRWGALPVGIGLTIGVSICTAIFINTFHIGPESPVVYVIATAVLCLSPACHIAIGLRAESLSAR